MPFELTNTVQINDLNFFKFEGWGDRLNGGNEQFEGIEIGILADYFIQIMNQFILQNTSYFSQ